MTQEVLKQMYQLLLTEPHAPTVCAKLERIAREALAEHAMSEVQRLGQEIEQCKYPDCKCPTENPCLKGLAQPEKWVGLTDEEIDDIYFQHQNRVEHQVAIWPYERAIEAKLKEKNCG